MHGLRNQCNFNNLFISSTLFILFPLIPLNFSKFSKQPLISILFDYFIGFRVHLYDLCDLNDYVVCCYFIKSLIQSCLYEVHFRGRKFYKLGREGLCPDWYHMHVEVVVVAFVKCWCCCWCICRCRQVVNNLISSYWRIMWSSNIVNCCYLCY